MARVSGDLAQLAASVLAGLLTGGVLGLTGAGGSILTLPALVGVVGLTPHQAVAASLVSVGGSAAAGAATHARDGRLRWREVLLFAILAGAAALVGGRLGRLLPDAWLMRAFGVLAIAVGIRMLFAGGGSSERREGEERRRSISVRLIATALAVGALSGVLGVGGGFLIVPALVGAVGLTVPEAIATSLAVIAINCAGALAGALPGLDAMPWGKVIPFVVASIAGSRLGAGIAGRWPADRLRRAFAIVAIVVGLAALWKYLLA